MSDVESPIFRDMVLQRFDQQDDQMREQRAMLEEIRRNTNGAMRAMSKDITDLKIWKARGEGAKAVFSWVPAVVGAVLGSGLGALIAVLATSH